MASVCRVDSLLRLSEYGAPKKAPIGSHRVGFGVPGCGSSAERRPNGGYVCL